MKTPPRGPRNCMGSSTVSTPFGCSPSSGEAQSGSPPIPRRGPQLALATSVTIKPDTCAIYSAAVSGLLPCSRSPLCSRGGSPFTRARILPQRPLSAPQARALSSRRGPYAWQTKLLAFLHSPRLQAGCLFLPPARPLLLPTQLYTRGGSAHPHELSMTLLTRILPGLDPDPSLPFPCPFPDPTRTLPGATLPFPTGAVDTAARLRRDRRLWRALYRRRVPLVHVRPPRRDSLLRQRLHRRRRLQRRRRRRRHSVPPPRRPQGMNGLNH